MIFGNGKISLRQLQALLILDIFGFGAVILPRWTAEGLGHNGWVLPFISLGISVLMIFIMSAGLKPIKNESFVEYISSLFGKYIGEFIGFLFFIKIILTLSFQVRIFSETIRETLLFKTPVPVISFGILFLGTYCALKGYETRGRIAEILIFAVLIPVLLIFCMALFEIDLENFQPILKDWEKFDIYKSVRVIFAFSGIELFMLAYPYVKNREKIGKNVALAILFTGLLMSMAVFITTGVFGVIPILLQKMPVLELMNTVEFPQAFLERQEAIVMSFWIIAAFFSINAGIFFSGLLLRDVFSKGAAKGRSYIYAVLFIAFALSFIPKNFDETYFFAETVNMVLGTFFMFVIPFVLCIFSGTKKGGSKNENA